MRFLSVADRELRSAARRKATYRMRWITATVFLGLLVWLMWAFDGFTNRRAVPDIFAVFSVLTFLYCAFLGAASTADCLSSERREGTLGLLFLTNLNSAEIILGKFCSSALGAVYGFMAIFPMLALPLLMGGITFGQFGRTVLALLNGIFFALSAGFLSSVLCKRQFTALAMAVLLTLGLGGGVMLGAAAATAYAPTRFIGHELAPFSPLYTLIAASGTTILGPNRFWDSAAVVCGISLGGMALTTLLLARTWRDRPKTAGAWGGFTRRERSERIPSATRAALRRRLLEINPFFWLGGRQRVSAPVLMVLVLMITVVTVYVAAPFFGRVMGAGAASPVLGHLFSWVWAGLGIHALVLYYAAIAASQRLAEDKQNGALELILSTPMTERTLSRGLWLAFWRKMLFPGLVAVLVHVYFLWLCMEMALLDPPGQIPNGTTQTELFWGAVLDKPIRGQAISWEFGFLIRCALLSLLILMLSWPTLGWVARWLGLRMKHPGFAPMASLGILIAPPILLFSLACYLVEVFNFDHLPERLLLPAMMWLALAIGVVHCAMLSLWAARRLRHDLRTMAMSRYQPLPAWRWRLPSRRTVLRFALGVIVSAAVVVSMIAGYYGYQNRRSSRAWQTFQTSLKQKGESLDLALLLPQPAPEDENFAESPAFLGLVRRTDRETRALLDRMQSFGPPIANSSGNSAATHWIGQTNSPLEQWASWIGSNPRPGSGRQKPAWGLAVDQRVQTTRQQDAAAILSKMQSQSRTLQELAAAARRARSFQVSTNRDFEAVFHPASDSVLLVERLHLLMQVRACALLALSRNGEAAEDVVTGLHLARLARQLPDPESMVRLQVMLARSLQPLWEGLGQHAWTEPQVAAIQAELAGFDLLADYTNTIRRIVLAHIEVWRAIPDNPAKRITLPAYGGYINHAGWEWQPRAWWFENCMQFYRAGTNAILKVDAATGRIEPGVNWEYLNGLPLDQPTRELFQQSWWWGANPSSIAFAVTSVNQANIACALERYRLTNGSYPETIERLVPTFLARVPHDAVSGRSIIYEPGGPGGFTLRGVGQNGTDDSKKTSSDDWLWTYARKPPPAKKPGRR